MAKRSPIGLITTPSATLARIEGALNTLPATESLVVREYRPIAEGEALIRQMFVARLIEVARLSGIPKRTYSLLVCHKIVKATNGLLIVAGKTHSTISKHAARVAEICNKPALVLFEDGDVIPITPIPSGHVFTMFMKESLVCA